MRKKINGSIQIWINKNEVNRFANQWPCLGLRDKRVYAEFIRGDIVDVKINNSYKDLDYCDQVGLNALIQDALKNEGIFKND